MSETASRVEFEPAPAIMGTRPLLAAIVISMTWWCSSWFSVGDSPVVPTGRRPLIPPAIWLSTSFSRSLTARDPSSVKGVARAVIDPVKRGILIINRECRVKD